MPGRYFRPLPRGLQTSFAKASGQEETFMDIISRITPDIRNWLDVLRTGVDETGNIKPDATLMTNPIIKEAIFKKLYPYFFGAGKPREVLTNLSHDTSVPYPPSMSPFHENRRLQSPLSPETNMSRMPDSPSVMEHDFPSRANILYFNNIYRHLAGQMDKLVPGWKGYEDKFRDYSRMQESGFGNNDFFLEESPYGSLNRGKPGELQTEVRTSALGNDLGRLYERLIGDTNPIAIRRAAVSPVIEWYKLRQRLGLGE